MEIFVNSLLTCKNSRSFSIYKSANNSYRDFNCNCGIQVFVCSFRPISTIFFKFSIETVILRIFCCYRLFYSPNKYILLL